MALNDRDVAAIVRICRQVDGLPLAIELAAARLTVLSPDELADRLGDSLAILRGGPRDGPDRHRALTATLDWSYQLLDPAEQAMLRRLSAFRGMFSLDDAIALCRWGELTSSDLLDVMSGLVDKSLVVGAVRDSSSYFRLLETVRQFGADRARASGDEPELRARHAAFCTEQIGVIAPRLRGPAAGAALDWLDRHNDDIHAALTGLADTGEGIGLLELAAVVWPYWDYRFAVTEGRAWLGRALEGAPPASQHRVAALAGAAKLARMDDDPAAATRACDEGLALARELGSATDAAPFLVVLGDLARDRGDDEDSIRLRCEEAADLFMAGLDLSGAGDAIRVMALRALDQGDLAGAERWGQQCMGLWDRCGDAERSAGIRSLLGGVCAERGDFVEAGRLYRESLALFERAREPWGTAQAICSLAALANLQRHPLEAVELGEDSLGRHRRLGVAWGVAKSLKVIADANLQLSRLQEADRSAEQALSAFRRRGFRRDIDGALLSAAAIALRRGDLPHARQLCDEALLSYRVDGRRGMAAVGLSILGVIAMRQSDLPGAARLLDEGRRLMALDPARGIIPATLAVLLERGDLDIDLSRPDDVPAPGPRLAV